MSLPGRLESMIHDLEVLDRSDRIDALIDLARRYQPPADPPPYPESARVPGCESEVFFLSERLADGRLLFSFAVQNPQGMSARALSVLLREGLVGVARREIAALPDDLAMRVFGRELSMGKNMGLTGMVRMLREAADRSWA